MQYGEFFKEARKRNELSQKQVAEKLNIRQSNISDWENDISRPEYEKLVALSEIYEVTLYDLFLGGGKRPFFSALGICFMQLKTIPN